MGDQYSFSHNLKWGLRDLLGVGERTRPDQFKWRDLAGRGSNPRPDLFNDRRGEGRRDRPS